MEAILSIAAAVILGSVFLKPKNFLYWCKWIISYVYIDICKRMSMKRFDLYDYKNRENPSKVNYIIPHEEYVLESPHADSHLLKRDDEIFFYGSNSKSELLIVKIKRECNNKAEACIYMKLANGNVYELVKTSDFQKSCTDEMTFSCGGLQLQCTNPMRGWRIFYAGYLRKVTEDNPTGKKMIYVNFALLWRASSDVFDFQDDISTRSLAQGLANASWNGLYPPFIKTQKILDFYGQTGVIHGTLTVENEFEEYEIYLFGHRIRYLGDTSDCKDLNFKHFLGYVKKNGTYFHLGELSASNAIENLSFGFVVQPDANLKGIRKACNSVSNSYEKENLKFSFSTDSSFYTFIGSSTKIVLPNESDKQTYSPLRCLEFELNGEKGHGIEIKRAYSKRLETEYSEVHELKPPSVATSVLSFNEEKCQLSEITGGKGSSLGKLTQLSKELQTFIVPNGIVVTTEGYEGFLTKNILTEIKILEEKIYNINIKSEEVNGACKRVSEAIIQTEIPTTLRESIKTSMEKYFGEITHSHKFAVRSSATGEDTEQMSSAGQMETFLGISGVEEVLHAVKKCWASQFSFIAIEYKRRYGQKLNSPMAVVIQEMVSCDVAGVLFTCDPLTGNPTLMSITANYGLGESVVSALEEPDVIQLKRDENDDVSILSVAIGAKCRKIIVEDKQGTNIIDVPEDKRNICSLSKYMILCLAQVAIKIEKHYRSHRDIEWGFFNNKLYIFQSRPITSGTNETIYEIEHEFDSPLRVENDFYSVSNVGEVVPGAFSPLGQNVILRAFAILLNAEDQISDVQVKTRTKYFSMGWLIMYSHYVFNIVDVFHAGLNDQLSVLEQATIISFFGRIPDNKEIFEVSKARYGDSPKMNSLLKMYNVIKMLFFSQNKIKSTMNAYSAYRIHAEKYKTAKTLYDAVIRSCWDILPVLMAHIIESQKSSIWNMIIFSTLGAAQGDFDDVVYRDFATLLKTDTDVESADVPSAIQSLAFHISKGMKPEEFKKMSTEEALKWLETSSCSAGKKFRNFIEKHGHRCLQEYDIYSHPWRENTESLVKLLQSLSGSVTKDTSEKKLDNLKELILKLNVPLGLFDKLKLKFILPLSRKAVQGREMTKSMLVKFVDEWRKAYRKLAQLMVQEGRIPEEDLLFFMTLDEVRQFLETCSPKIIARATQRKRRFPILHKYRFPEIMKGQPKPIEESEFTIISNEASFSMKGIPVSQGIAKGFIRKALNLDAAADIKPGEILLTHSTDIGWTPYFPQLAGVVTELGGLISHGAVVSREYGIPCIAGLHGATKQFQTGDYVLLDGNKGILQKLEEPQS